MNPKLPRVLETADGTARTVALDGLRGVASLVVVLHHLTLTNQWFADRVFHPGGLLPRVPWASTKTLLEFSPLHLFFAGTEAVDVFFVLSGVVLVQSVRRYSTQAYGLSRLVRLYIPILASVLFAAVLFLTTSGHRGHAASWFINAGLQRLTWRDLVANAWLLDGNTALNSVLWSMRYEVIFSLVLPIALWSRSATLVSRRVRALQLACLLVLAACGAQWQLGLLEYLPVFGVGVVLADTPVFRRANGLAAILGTLLVTAPWTLGGFGQSTAPWASGSLVIAGAALLVQAVRGTGWTASMFATAPARLLGRLSFSLYLVHLPIVYVVWLRWGPVKGATAELSHALLALAFSLATAGLFYWLVERRAVALAHRVRSALGGRA